MSHRAITTSALLLALAGLWACWCDVAMLWDGAYQLCCTLTSGVPFAYLSRFHSWVVWQPVTWLAPCMENIHTLRFVYGLPFCLAPLVSVLLCAWLVRRTAPHLMLWSLFGAALAPLPGQIFMINDSIFQMHLFWPVFLASLLPASRWQVVVIGLLSLFQLSHPIGIGLCGLTALAAGAWARWKPAAPVRYHLAWALWLLLLAAGGWGKLLLWPDDYAAREATVSQVWMTFRWGVLWWPAAGLLTAWLAAALLVLARAQPRRWSADRLSAGALALLVITGGCWLYWAADPSIWQTAANYRRWLVPMSFPFLLAAGWEMWRPKLAEADPQAAQGRNHAGVAVALIFLLVLGLQATEWARLYRRLAAQVAASPSPWLDPGSLAWSQETPMDHWGLASQIYTVQGRAPLVALGNSAARAAAYATPPRVALSPFNYFTPGSLTLDWFRWSPFLQRSQPEHPSSAVDEPADNL